MNTTTFKPIAPRPAPVNTEGPVAWVKTNLLADWKTSLATLVIGGVLLSTLLTLLVVPCAYSLLAPLESHRHEKELNQAFKELGEASAEAK